MNADVTASPTMTRPSMTEVGMILGTAAYMSPEQARGAAVDKRTDIWAFGCVLYEMLTGRRAYAGDDIAGDTLRFILTTEPDWNALPANTPAAVRRLLRRCLHKDRKRRLADIADARLEIDDAIALPREALPVVSPFAAWRLLLLGAVGGLIVGAATVALVWNRRPVQLPTSGVARMVIALPPGDRLGVALDRSRLAISDDGNRVAYVASRAGTEQLSCGR